MTKSQRMRIALAAITLPFFTLTAAVTPSVGLPLLAGLIIFAAKR